MKKVLRVALFSVDPPGLTLFKTFDPESFSVIPAINDALIMIDEEGEVRPALATAWRQITPFVLELDLRQGVRFHNGEPFDADSVIATFEAHNIPTPSALAHSTLANFKAVHKLGPFRIQLEMRVPDALLLRCLFFVSIYPRSVLEQHGREAFERHPIGTGAYRVARYDYGRELVLERNTEHWAQVATVDQLRLPILRQKEWVHGLATGTLDVAFNLDSNDCLRAQRIPGLRGASREADVSQWFLLAQRGPLADVRVRRALNHAINRRILVDLTEHGLGSPQRSAASRQTEGYVELDTYRYSPELARRLLHEAGFGGGFKLHGLVSETSTALYFAVREFLTRIDVQLEADVVPRAAWMQRIMGSNARGEPYEGDFAVTSCDNPILHSLFMQQNFFSSQGPGSLTRDPTFDGLLLKAATSVEAPLPALAELERYHRDQALMLFTVQQHVHAAWREGIEVTLPRSGHFDASAFWKLSVGDGRVVERLSLPPPATPSSQDLRTLLDGTSHTGAFYLGAEAQLEEPTSRRIWTNLTESEQRWRMQNEPMLRELVSSIEARTNLASVLSSTDRVAIVGYSPEGRELFHNRGYELMFGSTSAHTVFDYLGHEGAHGWRAVQAAVERDGVWLGPVHISLAHRPPDAPEQLFLAVSPARDEDNTVIGHTFVFSDFSGEEERIKTAATRTILENVPYGLFMTDPHGRMLTGYSDACRDVFRNAGSTDLTGRLLTELLELDARRADHFQAAYGQVIDDLLPSEVSLGQLPPRFAFGERTFSLRGSVVYSDEGAVTGVLFTMADISALVTAEHEAEHHRATVMILRFRDSFESFARELSDELQTLAQRPAERQPEIRALLHTAKGVLAQFSLSGLAEHIHTLEDDSHIVSASLTALRKALHETLQAHGVELSTHEQAYTVSESFVRELEQRVLSAGDLHGVRSVAREGLRRLRETRAGDLLGPLREAAETQAACRGKLVNVRIFGADERIPRGPGHLLGKLVHLVRNAIDHGLEEAHERGDKDPTGTLSITVTRTPEAMRVTVADDGRGIDTARLIERAVALNLLTLADAALLSRRDQLALVFVDGLSTAEAVTETSGRGVGVAALRAEVAALHGTIELESMPGKGTTFTLSVPLETL